MNIIVKRLRFVFVSVLLLLAAYSGVALADRTTSTNWEKSGDGTTLNADSGVTDICQSDGTTCTTIGAASGDLLADGTVPLTADWDAGNSLYDITAVEFKGALIGNADTSTTAANLSGTPDLPDGTTATTQSASDNSTKLATTAYADAAGGGAVAINDLTDAIYDGSSLMMGNGAGANDDGANLNVFVGKSAGNGNVSGFRNTFIGYEAGLNSTGSDNFFMGYRAGYNSTVGNNAFIGRDAGFNTTTGSSNVFIGIFAASVNTTGGSNIAIGSEAGRYITDGSTPNTTGDFNVFLGRDTKALADNDQNEIVIGYDATGIGSNTVTLGNTSIIKVQSSGSLNLGERAAAEADVAAFGQVWVKSDAPNTLWFTDDVGTDAQLVGEATTNTFTNKTFDANGTGNSLSNVDLTADVTGALSTTTGAFTSASSLTLGTASSAAGGLIYKNATNANTVTVQSGVTSGSYTLTLPLAVGAAGTSLTDAAGDGVLSWAAAGGGGTPIDAIVATAFETAARFNSGQSGTGSQTYNVNGLVLDTGATATSHSAESLSIGASGSYDMYNGSPTFSAIGRLSGVGSAGSYYVGMGAPAVNGAAHFFNDRHVGFKIVVSGSTATLYATQADGSTETASSALTTLSSTEPFDLIVQMDAFTGANYYWRKAGGVLSSATNLTTNLPASGSADNKLGFSVSNHSTAVQQEVLFTSASYRR